MEDNNNTTHEEGSNDDGDGEEGGRPWWERGQLEAIRDGYFGSSEDEIDDG